MSELIDQCPEEMSDAHSPTAHRWAIERLYDYWTGESPPPLPTSDPAVAGALWNNNGIVSVSNG